MSVVRTNDNVTAFCINPLSFYEKCHKATIGNLVLVRVNTLWYL